MVADFLVTTDGKYLYNGIIRYLNAPELFEDVVDWLLDLPASFDHNFYDVVFSDNGRVRAFGPYMSVFNSKTNEHAGYIAFEDFWKNARPSNGSYINNVNKPRDLTYYWHYRDNDGFVRSSSTLMARSGGSIFEVPFSNKVKPREGDNIILATRNVIFDDNALEYKIETEIRSFKFPGKGHSLYETIKDKLDYKVVNGSDNSEHIITNDSFFQAFPDSSSETLSVTLTVATSFHLAIIHGNILANGYKFDPSSERISFGDDANIIDGITLLFQMLFKNEKFTEKLSEYNFTFLFSAFFEIFFNPIEANTAVISEAEFYEKYTLEYYNTLYIRLREFYLWINGAILVTEYDFLTRAIGLFHDNILQQIPYAKKLELLERLLSDNFWVSGRWNPFLSDNKLTEEEVIVKIIQSIKRRDENDILNHTEINDFMDKLCANIFFDPKATISLYQKLYNSIDPDVIFGGAGVQGQLVDAIYSLWLDSRYNPKSVLPPGFVHHVYTYTEYNAMRWLEDGDTNTNDIDYSAAPKVIPYESEKVWLWYKDNMNFFFHENKIGSTLNSLPYGYHHIFQPINIVAIKSVDGFVSIPIDPNVLQNYENPCDIAESGRGNNLPVFYLKYVDDVGDKKDFEESALLALDVGLTLLGGWGVARRLIAEGVVVTIRNLTATAISTSIPAAVDALPIVTRNNLLRVLKSVAIPTIEFVLGVASIAHNIVEGNCTNYNDCNNAPPQEGSPDYEAYLRCQALQKWLFALEILTLSGDVISRAFFKKASREARQILPDTNPYPEIPNSEYADLLSRLNQMTITVAESTTFLNRFPPSVRTFLENMPLSKREAFIDDFINQADGVIDQLANSSNAQQLIERWSSLHTMRVADRVQLDVLKNPALVNGYLHLFSRYSIGQFISKLDFQKRVKFIEKYTRPPYNFSQVHLDKITESPSRLTLMLTHMDSPNIRQMDKLNDADIIKIVTSDLLDIHVALHEIKISISLKMANRRYLKLIKNVEMSMEELENMYKGNVTDFVGGDAFNKLDAQVKKTIVKRNKYITQTKIYNDNTLVATVNENFISGRLQKIKNAFNNNIPAWLTNPSDQALFDIFSSNAFDLLNRSRDNDTELKYIFNFLSNHWHLGNRFDITVKSTLYTCSSCRGYLTYLQELAQKQGKTVSFNVIAHSEYDKIDDLQKAFGPLN